ncbi:hypothetical protein [Elstera litoralis]|uniref:hypothetical protein n=1 Tax=Elstera litoralis TaxID=552518 RepID=UPI002FC3A714
MRKSSAPSKLTPRPAHQPPDEFGQAEALGEGEAEPRIAAAINPAPPAKRAFDPQKGGSAVHRLSD